MSVALKNVLIGIALVAGLGAVFWYAEYEQEAKVGEPCEWITSVCTGALLLHEAGFARGRRVTTHWGFAQQLRERGDVTVRDELRFVRDGRLVTAAGVSAGIDMALWLVGQLHSPDLARKVQRYLQYDPAPPYSAEA